MYVDACDYFVHRIEYLDGRGRIVATAELDAYEPVTEAFYVPTRVQVAVIGPDDRRDSIDITLKSIKPMEFSERLQEVIFNPPDLDRFENIYAYVDGQWITQR